MLSPRRRGSAETARRLVQHGSALNHIFKCCNGKFYALVQVDYQPCFRGRATAYGSTPEHSIQWLLRGTPNELKPMLHTKPELANPCRDSRNRCLMFARRYRGSRRTSLQDPPLTIPLKQSRKTGANLPAQLKRAFHSAWLPSLLLASDRGGGVVLTSRDGES